MNPIRPKRLRSGDTVEIVAPAGPIADRAGLDAGVAAIERLGFRARFDERVLESRRYLAGDDRARAEELMRAFEDPAVAAILALRGGYGSARLLPLLEPARLQGRCKVFMGFSDLTTLHLYFARRFGWTTLHGPMATSPALHSMAADEAAHLVALWTDPGYRTRLAFPQLESWRGGSAEGRLTGGCLSLVVASLGTAYEIDTDGAILFLEDLGEAPYRVDRMLTHLRLAGKLDSVAGIVLGSFADCQPPDAGYSFEEMLRELLEPIEVPIVAHFPAGHGAPNWALPLGVKVRLDGDAPALQILDGSVE